MAALSAGLAWLVLGVPVALAALLGACTAPTDPVLSSSVVTGKPAEEHLPARTRQLLSVESGTNDGLALPLVLLGIALVVRESVGRAALDGLYQVGVGMAVGVVIGLVTGWAVSYALRHSDVDQGASLVFTLVLAVAVLGVARVVQADGVLSVFVAGLAYNAVVANDEVGPQNTIDEGVNRYVVLPCSCCRESNSPGRSGRTWVGSPSCSRSRCCCCDGCRSSLPSSVRWGCGCATGSSWAGSGRSV